MKPEPVYRFIASKLAAIANCERSKNVEWGERHTSDVDKLIRNSAPSGSGIDNGTNFDWEHSTPEKLVFTCGFHHMNEAGMYDGWTDHTITVKPSLQWGIDIAIGGRNRNDIKEYLHETISMWLNSEVSWDEDAKDYVVKPEWQTSNP